MNLERTWIRNVIVYSGHEQNPLCGPYSVNVTKQHEMFETLNFYREINGRPKWKVTLISGENLIEALKSSQAKETLLVIPAGQSSHLDQVFSTQQISYIRDIFLKEQGGRLYATCGASYAMTSVREYDGLSLKHPNKRELSIKQSVFSIFNGIAKGPLCPFPGAKYQVGFYSDAVRVTNGEDECTIYLSGGGSFVCFNTTQKVHVLVKYSKNELCRLGKTAEQAENLENATILTSVGKGAALLSMFHPYYGSHDIDVETYTRTFPDCGTDWKAVKEALSPLEQRMQFVLKSMLFPLEDNVEDETRSLR